MSLKITQVCNAPQDMRKRVRGTILGKKMSVISKILQSLKAQNARRLALQKSALQASMMVPAWNPSLNCKLLFEGVGWDCRQAPCPQQDCLHFPGTPREGSGAEQKPRHLLSCSNRFLRYQFPSSKHSFKASFINQACTRGGSCLRSQHMEGRRGRLLQASV